MIRHGKNTDIQQLKEIWKEAFDDDSDYGELFFAQIFREEYALCEEENGRIRAMLYKLPCILKQENGRQEKGCYFYALATRKQFRGQGIMGALIQAALKEVQAEGASAFLIPAEKGLARYYIKQGFHFWTHTDAWNNDRKKTVEFPSHIEAFWIPWAKEGQPPVYVGSTAKTGALYGWIPL